MKKLVAVLVICLLMVPMLCACNEGLGWGNYSWTHIHFTDAVEGCCATIEVWYKNTTGIEVKTQEYGSMFLSEGSYILFENGETCPFCH
jgi:hypothetical protein